MPISNHIMHSTTCGRYKESKILSDDYELITAASREVTIFNSNDNDSCITSSLLNPVISFSFVMVSLLW